MPDNRVVTYDHDPLGRRIAKSIDGVVVEKYLWQGLTKLLAVYDGSDTLVQRFEYADGRMPVAMTRDGGTYFLACDQVGSLRIVTDASGNVVKRIDYDTFGNILNDTNSSLTVPFGFAGGLHDLDTGLVRFGHRDFNPDTGRWTAKDPIGFAGGDTDLYRYVQNNPVNFVDTLGLKDFFIGIEGDLVGIVGVEGGFGIVIDTDNWGDTGFFGGIGPAVGANVGIGVGAGIVNEVEGWSYNLDVNLGTFSPTGSMENNGLNGGGFSVGPGYGVSASAINTGSFTINDAIGYAQSFADWMIEETYQTIFGVELERSNSPCE